MSRPTNPSEDNSVAITYTIVDRVRRRKLELFGHTSAACRTIETVRDGGWSRLQETTKEALGRRHTEVVRHDVTTGGTYGVRYGRIS